MSSYLKYFLIFDGVVVLLVLWWIFKKPKASRLRMSFKKSDKKTLSGELSSDKFMKPQSSGGQKTSVSERSLSVLFNYNGHSFEAYETLGLPAGSSLESAVTAFNAIKIEDDESREFLKAALEAIRKSQ